MKNLSLGLNAVLIVAVAILYFLHFSSATPKVEEVETPEVEIVEEKWKIKLILLSFPQFFY